MVKKSGSIDYLRYQGGGEMIERVSFEKTTFERPPLKFEAGTPDYIATHGLATALDYVTSLGMDNILLMSRTSHVMHFSNFVR